MGHCINGVWHSDDLPAKEGLFNGSLQPFEHPLALMVNTLQKKAATTSTTPTPAPGTLVQHPQTKRARGNHQ